MSGVRHRYENPVVRPRWVWGGLTSALAGASLLGWGLSTGSRPWTLAGAATLVVGAAASVRGGVLSDATSAPSPGTALDEVATKTEHRGVTPGAMVQSPAARQRAAWATRTTQRLEAERHATATPPLAMAAGWMLLVATTVLIASQWELVAHDPTGRSNSYRDTGLAILIGVAGLRLVVAPGRHTAFGAIAVLAGVGLVLGGWFAEHHHPGLAGVEVVFGALTVVAAVAALAGRASVRPAAPDTTAGRRRAKAAPIAVAEGATTYTSKVGE